MMYQPGQYLDQTVSHIDKRILAIEERLVRMELLVWWILRGGMGSETAHIRVSLGMLERDNILVQEALKELREIQEQKEPK